MVQGNPDVRSDDSLHHLQTLNRFTQMILSRTTWAAGILP